MFYSGAAESLWHLVVKIGTPVRSVSPVLQAVTMATNKEATDIKHSTHTPSNKLRANHFCPEWPCESASLLTLYLFIDGLKRQHSLWNTKVRECVLIWKPDQDKFVSCFTGHNNSTVLSWKTLKNSHRCERKRPYKTVENQQEESEAESWFCVLIGSWVDRCEDRCERTSGSVRPHSEVVEISCVLSHRLSWRPLKQQQDASPTMKSTRLFNRSITRLL